MVNLKEIGARLKERGYEFKDWTDGLSHGFTLKGSNGIDGHIGNDGYFFVRKDKRLVYSQGQIANIDENVRDEFNYIIYGR